MWLRQVAVALVYALGYSLFKEVSFSHWLLVAGFRLCALLLVPFRYWPALLIGEAGALAYVAIPCAELYGWLWAIELMIPPMLLAMPVVVWFRKRRLLFPSPSATSMNALLLCTLLVTMLGTGADMLTVVTGHLAPPSAEYSAIAGRYFLGNYLGVLTLVPITLILREELQAWPVSGLWSRLAASRLALESASLLLPSLALLAWLASSASDASQAARVAMFLPVAWLALRHGWRGAAIGGSAASIAIVLTMPVTHDNDTLEAQVFIAFTISTMLLLGARIASLCQIEKKEHQDARMVLAMAQRNIYVGEMQLRQTSYVLEEMSRRIRSSHDQLLGRLRFLVPHTDERGYHREAAATQQQIYRLADTLYPLAWGERGLPAVLREGSIPRALDEAGVGYWCEITGRGLSELSPSVHMAIYRLSCEAIAIACSERNVGKVHVRLRGGVLGGRRWAVLCVDSYAEARPAQQVSWDNLLPLLGGSGMGLAAIKDRASVFEGQARERSLAGFCRISIILFDPN